MSYSPTAGMLAAIAGRTASELDRFRCRRRGLARICGRPTALGLQLLEFFRRRL